MLVLVLVLVLCWEQCWHRKLHWYWYCAGNSAGIASCCLLEAGDLASCYQRFKAEKSSNLRVCFYSFVFQFQFVPNTMLPRKVSCKAFCAGLN